MPETKTFKNVTISKFAGANEHWRIYPSDDSEVSQLLVSDWNMEVTFTRKQPKLEIGGTCNVQGYTAEYVICAFDDKFVWLRDPQQPEDSGWIEERDQIHNVKPWRPA